ncbi:MAG: exodeoxyribonuclease VII small subunit [Thermoleophilia bacterium]
MNDETESGPHPDNAQPVEQSDRRNETPQTASQPNRQTDPSAKEGVLTSALAGTLDNLNQSIERMETIVRKLEAGESDWEESVRLLSEANELAMESSQKLDRVVQDVVYGSPEDEPREPDRIPGL